MHIWVCLLFIAITNTASDQDHINTKNETMKYNYEISITPKNHPFDPKSQTDMNHFFNYAKC